MKQIEHKKQITWRWGRSGKWVILPDHVVDELDKLAMNRISEMSEQGFTSGELCATLTDQDSKGHEIEVEYTGWWEVKTME
jgi:hypothetical protein